MDKRAQYKPWVYTNDVYLENLLRIFLKIGDNLLHLHEEETKLLPELQRLCTDEELRAIEHLTYDLMTSEEMVEMIQILFPHMNFFDKCAFLTDIKLAQPEKFLQLWEKANCFLNADEFTRLEESGIIFLIKSS